MKYITLLLIGCLTSCSILKDGAPLVQPGSFLIAQTIVDNSDNPKKDYEQIKKISEFLNVLSIAMVDTLGKNDFITLSVVDENDKKWVAFGEQLWDIYKNRLSQTTLDKVTASSVILRDMAAGLNSVYLKGSK